MRVMAVAIRRIAGNRQERDAFLGDGDPAALAGQELEPAALLAVGSRRAIASAATQASVLAVDAGIDFMGARG